MTKAMQYKLLSSAEKLLRLPKNTHSGSRDRAGQRLNSLKQEKYSMLDKLKVPYKRIERK